MIEDREFVGIGDIKAHRTREELDWGIGLKPGGLIGDQCVRCGVGLVEAVARKLLHQTEKKVSQFRGHAPLGGSGHEAFPLLVHFLLLFLPHGPTQQVGLAEAVIARQDLGDLHHLFLVNDYPVGRGEHWRQQWVQHVSRGFRPILVST